MGLKGLKNMGRVIGETLLEKLASIEAVDKELDRPFQGFDTSGEATRTASQAGQIMTQFSIIAFHRVGVGLSIRDFITTVVVPQAIIGIKSITMILFGFDGFIYQVLDHLLAAFPDHFVAQKTTRGSIYDREDVDPLFFAPMKVNSSSISASLTASGTGAAGKLATLAWIHKATVR